MLTVKKVVLKNVRSFLQETPFEFENAKVINTISGINGSGKSTVFKALMLAQRAFFHNQLEDSEERRKSIANDLLAMLNEVGAFITITFEIVTESTISHATFRVRCVERTNEHIVWRLEASDSDLAAIRQYWDITKPRDIIVFIDSNRFISEQDFSSGEISISQSKNLDDLVLDYIFYPERLFGSIYERIIRDYARERIIPSRPRRDLPHVASKILLRELLDYLEVSKFTSQVRDGQFVLQVRQRKNKKLAAYDVRHLSSGEKTLFYTLHFICYVRSISLLVIDEPENNLHENMLAEFVELLNRICITDDFSDLLIRLASKNGVELKPNVKKQLTTLYKSHSLSNVYLLTHSRSLIYNVFNFGANYYVEGGLKRLDYDEAELTMRSIGLSKIYNRVLFVEGISDARLVESIVGPLNVKVRQLGGCTQVISAYTNYLRVKSEVRDTQFCFMIDRDTRNDTSIEALRAENPAVFDENFVVLDRHELENYFLDAKLFREVYRREKQATSLFPDEVEVPTANEIEQALKTIADGTREQVMLKTLQQLNSESLGGLQEKLTAKNLPLEAAAYETFIKDAFDTTKHEETLKAVQKNWRTAKISLSQWDSKWKELCDGKKALHKYLEQVAQEVPGATAERITLVMIKAAHDIPSCEAHEVLVKVTSRFRK